MIELVCKYLNDDNVLEQFLVGSSGLKCCVSRETRTRQWMKFESDVADIHIS